MDPLTCLSLASSIVQLVDFSYKLISGSKEIYGSVSGASKENDELEIVIENLSHLCGNLRPPLSTGIKKALSDDEKALQSIADLCKEVADEILVALGKLKVEGKHLRWKALYGAIKAVTGKEKMRCLQEQLARAQTQLLLRLTNTLSNETAAITSTLSEMVTTSHRMETTLASKLDSMHGETLYVLGKLMKSYCLEDDEDDKPGDLICVEELSVALHRLTTEGALVSESLDVLESLYYHSIDARHSAVKEEHYKTFRWIFEKPDEEWDCDPPRFTEWLERENGIYWIAGKPGCGKSTLMKFLWHHFQTRNILEAWAGRSELVIACHFFWNAGNDQTQMSLDAMLRGLLYQAFIQCPELIPTICGSRFHDSVRKVRIRDIRSQISVWRISELIQAFTQLVGTSHLSFCFFIDGLDEYSGDHFEIVQMFGRISAAENVKFVISSRPWNVFEEAFGGDGSWKLLLQDLTRKDITEYVNDKLAEDTRFCALAARDPRYKDLIQQIVEKARGVFLWVVLVVDSLRNGLSDYDEISDMQRRLDFLPSNLRQFFRHIINGIEEVRQPQMAETFQMCLHAKSALPIAALACLKQERTQPDYAFSNAIAPISGATMLKTKSKMHLYLNATCKGLLEINHDPYQSFSFGYKLDFLHRTVRDFLMTPEISQLLKEKVSPGFNVHLTLCRASLAMLKMLQPEEINDYKLTTTSSDTTPDLINHALMYAKECERFSGQTPYRVLENVSHIFTNLFEPVARQSIFVSKAVATGLCMYTESKLASCPFILDESEFQPIVNQALHPKDSPELPRMTISPTMAQIIQKHAAINRLNRKEADKARTVPATLIPLTPAKSTSSSLDVAKSVSITPIASSPNSPSSNHLNNSESASSAAVALWEFATIHSPSLSSTTRSRLETPFLAVGGQDLSKSHSVISPFKLQERETRRRWVSRRFEGWLKKT